MNCKHQMHKVELLTSFIEECKLCGLTSAQIDQEPIEVRIQGYCQLIDPIVYNNATVAFKEAYKNYDWSCLFPSWTKK